jgi:hypothetical protein
MKNTYSDSLLPFSIGTSFTVALFSLLLAGAGVGYLLCDCNLPPQSGGIILLIIMVLLVVMPLFYNRKKSSFEQRNTLIEKYDGIGIIQGLKGAMFRLLIYEEGVEIRAFYHRFYIPYENIKTVAMEEESFGFMRLRVKTGLAGIPDYIIANDKIVREFAHLLERKVKSQDALPSGIINRVDFQ